MGRWDAKLRDGWHRRAFRLCLFVKSQSMLEKELDHPLIDFVGVGGRRPEASVLKGEKPIHLMDPVNAGMRILASLVLTIDLTLGQ